MSKKYITDNIKIDGQLLDGSGSAGTSGQILSSTGTGTDWVSLSEISGVDGSGTANYIPKWTDSDTLGDSLISQSGSIVDINGTIRYDKQIASNLTSGAKAFIAINSGVGAAKYKVYKNTNVTDGYARFKLDRAYDYGSNNQMVQEAIYQRRNTTKNVRFRYDGDITTADDSYLEFYELTDGTVEGWVCVDDYSKCFAEIYYDADTSETYPNPSSGTPTGTLIHSTNPDTSTPNWDSYQGNGYFSGNVGIGTTSTASKLTSNGRIEAISLNPDHFRARYNSSYYTDYTTNGLKFNGPNQTYAFEQNGTTRLFINSSGNVGIGETNISEKLHVAGNIYATGQAQAANAIMKTYSGYAMFGSNSSTVPVAIGRDAANLDLIINSSGNVGINETSPGALLDIKYKNSSTNIYRASDAAGQYRWRVDQNFDMFITNSSGTDTSRIYNNGNAHFDGTGQFGSYATIGTNVAGGFYQDATNGAYRATGTTGDRGFYFQPYSGSTTYMYVGLTGTYAGKVGIGTTSPDSLLNIEGSRNNAILTIGNSTNDSSWTIGDKLGAINFYSADNSGAGSGVKASLSYEVAAGTSSATNAMVFRTAGTTTGTNNVERMRIDADGNVGIGTTTLTNSSGYKTLSISGSAGGQIAFQTAGTGKHYIWGTATDFNIYNSTAGNLILYTNATERMRIASNGNVGIGTPSPLNGGSTARWLTINGDSGSSYSGGIAYSINGSAKAYHYVQDNNLIHEGLSGVGHRFFANGSEKMRITSGGNILMGTTSTTRFLTVAPSTGAVVAAFMSNSATGGIELQSSTTTASGWVRVMARGDGLDLVVGLNNSAQLLSTGQLKLNQYSSISAGFSGTPYKMLAVDSSGNVISENVPKTLEVCNLFFAVKASSTGGVAYPYWNGNGHATAVTLDSQKIATYSGSLDVVKIACSGSVTGVSMDLYKASSPTVPIWSSGSFNLTANTVYSISPSSAAVTANDLLYLQFNYPASGGVSYNISLGFIYN